MRYFQLFSFPLLFFTFESEFFWSRSDGIILSAAIIQLYCQNIKLYGVWNTLATTIYVFRFKYLGTLTLCLFSNSNMHKNNLVYFFMYINCSHFIFRHNCQKCMVIHEKHPNVLQYKESKYHFCSPYLNNKSVTTTLTRQSFERSCKPYF